MPPKFKTFISSKWIPKNRKILKKEIELFKSPTLKELNKASLSKVDSGQDAFFNLAMGNRHYLGVADGVGGWESVFYSLFQVGVDSSLFSWTLMKNSEIAIYENSNKFEGIEPIKILEKAYNRLIEEGQVPAGKSGDMTQTLLGSSTASILSINKENAILESINLGDSSFMIIRDGSVFFKEKEQQHYFNCPYQLTVLPDNYKNKAAVKLDIPSDGVSRTIQLKDSDLILLATDGYFDNVYDNETLTFAENGFFKKWTQAFKPEETTKILMEFNKNLVNMARNLSLNKKRMSPFSIYAKDNGIFNYKGGYKYNNLEKQTI